jgi:hypothetical protein
MHEKDDGHALALERLSTAQTERDRRADEYDAAAGSSGELAAFTELRAAEDQVAAREAWLLWMDRDYRAPASQGQPR